MVDVGTRATLRPSILISALLIVTSPATAQNWQEYSYPDYSFRVTFPADPQIEAATYRVTDDRTVEAHVYSVRRDNAEFKLTIAELADAGLEPAAVIDHAVKTLSAGGEVKVNVPHHVMAVFGRQLSLVEGDGSRLAVALFAYNRRLYQIEGKSLPAGKDATADAIRFVQSLIFTDGGSNRSAEEPRSAESACSGSHGGTIPNGDHHFETECRRQNSVVALVSALNSGDLHGAQQAYASLSQLQSFADAHGPFAEVISQIGQALDRGDLTEALRAMESHLH
jgi:hypothetical protein